MKPTLVQLSPAIPTFIHTDERGIVGFTEANCIDLTRHILTELGTKFGREKFRALSDKDRVYPNEGITASNRQRIPRYLSQFVPAYLEAVSKLVGELSIVPPKSEVSILETRYSDDIGFAPENAYGDFVYVYARLIGQKA